MESEMETEEFLGATQIESNDRSADLLFAATQPEYNKDDVKSSEDADIFSNSMLSSNQKFTLNEIQDNPIFILELLKGSLVRQQDDIKVEREYIRLTKSNLDATKETMDKGFMADRAEVDAELAQVKALLAQAKLTESEYLANINQLASERASTHDDMSILKSQHEELSLKILVYEGKCELNEMRIKEIESELELEKESVSEANQELKDALGRIKQVGERANGVSQKLKSELSNVEKVKTEVTIKYETLGAEFKALVESKSELQTDYDNQVEELSTRNEKIMKQFDALKEGYTALTNDSSRREKEMEDKIKTLEEELKVLNKYKEDSDELEVVNEKERSRLHDQRDRLQKELEELTLKQRLTFNDFENVSKKLEPLYEELESARTSNEKSKERVENLETRLKTTEDALADSKQQLIEANRIASSNATSLHLEAEKTAKTAKLEAVIASLNENVASLQSKLLIHINTKSSADSNDGKTNYMYNIGPSGLAPPSRGRSKRTLAEMSSSGGGGGDANQPVMNHSRGGGFEQLLVEGHNHQSKKMKATIGEDGTSSATSDKENDTEDIDNFNCYLKHEGDGNPINIPEDSNGLILGRGDSTGIADKGVSRKHIRISIDQSSKQLFVSRLSVNASYVKPRNEMNYAQLLKDVPFRLHRGDQVCLLMRKNIPVHKYIVCLEEKKNALVVEEEEVDNEEEENSLEIFDTTDTTPSSITTTGE